MKTDEVKVKVKGKLIAIEGIDGAGKSTLVKSMQEALKATGVDVETVKEPSDDIPGKMASSGCYQHKAEALLYVVDREGNARYLEALVNDVGAMVITDRYEASTLAYQSAILGDAWMPWLKAVCDGVGMTPDITILLDIDPALSMRRIIERGEPSRYETAEYLRRVRHNYLSLAVERGYYIVDATKPAEDVLAEVMSILDREQTGDWWAIRRVKRIMHDRFTDAE